MEKIVQTFTSFDEADRADAAYYRSLTPEERIGILLDLIRQTQLPKDETEHRIERVYRIVKLSQS